MTEIEIKPETKKSLFVKANKVMVPLKVGLTGVSGGGKTYCALLLAKSIIKNPRIGLIDAENNSSALYSHLCDFSVLNMQAPYSPQRYIKAIEMAEQEGFDPIIIDGISPEWDGPGGCLDIHNKLGGRFQDWAKITPMHKDFIDKILHSKANIIVTMRRKQDYSMVQKDGRMQVEKMGLKEIQRDGFEYELTINFSVESNHTVTASKDRTGLFSDGVPFIITEKTGQMIREWNEKG
jgi:hypothetical protein